MTETETEENRIKLLQQQYANAQRTASICDEKGRHRKAERNFARAEQFKSNLEQAGATIDESLTGFFNGRGAN